MLTENLTETFHKENTQATTDLLKMLGAWLSLASILSESLTQSKHADQ